VCSSDLDAYTIHYIHAKLCLRLGLKITKIHKALRFRQTPWLKSFMLFNMEARKNAVNAFEASQIKLISVSCYGKMLESVRSRLDIKLVNNKNKLQKLLRKPNLKRFEIYDDNLASLHMQRTEAFFNKPIACAFSVLEISKEILYHTYYEKLMPVYGEQRLTLYYLDTDSLLVSIIDAYVLDEMHKFKEWFDTSNFDKDHPYYSCENKGLYGCLKSETANHAILEYVGLRAKMYSLLCDTYEKRICKGIKKSVIERDIRHEQYKQSLFEERLSKHSMTLIRSIKHKLYTIELNKTSLCSYDDKRYIERNPEAKTYAFGHYKLSK
jgi:hypothetical protein